MTLLHSIAIVLMAHGAEAARYTCAAAQTMSKLGARDGDYVIVTADEGNKECRFSVNGEPAGSPPRGAILNALTQLRTNTAATELSKGNVDQLAVLLLAASRETVVSDDFRKTLFANRPQLADCIAAAEMRTPEKFPGFGNDDVFCRMLKGGAEVGFGGPFQIVIETEMPYASVGVRRGRTAYFLFIPLADR